MLDIKPTLKPAMALVACWLLIAMVSLYTEPLPVYGFLTWLVLIPCFAWIYRIVRRSESNSGGEIRNQITSVLIAVGLTFAYALAALVITVNLSFLVGGRL